jgi:hypothetical protein
MEIALTKTPPTAVDSEDLQGATTLALGAPSIGKTHCFKQRAVDYAETLEAALAAADEDTDAADGDEAESEEHQPIVVDEFYRAYQRATTEQREQFLRLLGESHNGPDVCVVARPRSLDWLVEEGGLPENVLGNFDQVLLFGYDPQTDAEIEDARADCAAVADDIEALSDEALEQLRYPPYEFRNDRLQSTLGIAAYGPTLVPPLVADISDELAEAGSATSVSGILPDAVADAGADLSANFGVATFIGGASRTGLDLLRRASEGEIPTTTGEITRLARQAIENVGAIGAGTAETAGDFGSVLGESLAGLDAENATSALGQAGLAAFGYPPFATAAGLLVFLLFRESSDGSDHDLSDSFDGLVDANRRMLPPTRERFEAQLGLPPYTFEALEELTDPATLDRLTAVADAIDPEELERFGELTDALEDYEGDIETFVGMVDSLEARVSTLDGFVSENTRDATATLADLEDGLQQAEANLLDTDADTVDPATMPYVGRMQERVGAGLADSDVVVLRGPHGTGKTTTAYRVCRALRRDGYTIRVPNFRKERSYIERALDRTDTETVLFTSYIDEEHDEGVGGDGRPGIETVLEWVVEGRVDRVIIECRDERWPELQTDADLAAQKNDPVRRLWDNRRTVRFDRLETAADSDRSEATIADIVEYVFARKGVADPPEELVAAVAEFAGGNPEIAKIAALATTRDAETLDTVDTADDLVWNEIRGSFNTDGGAALFEYLAVCRQLSTDEIDAVVGLSGDELTDLVGSLSGYLGGSLRENVVEPYAMPGEDDELTIRPAVYGDVVFRKRVLGEGTDLMSYVYQIASERPQLLQRLAVTLGVAYEQAGTWAEDSIADTVIEAGSMLPATLRQSADVGERDYYRFVRSVILVGIPIAPGPVSEGRNTIATGAAIDTDAEAGIDVADVLENLFAQLLVSHTRAETGSVGEVTEAATAVAVDADVHDHPPGQFLTNVYSMALSGLVEGTPTQSDIDARVDAIETSAEAAADADVHDLSPGEFLENVYSSAVFQLSYSSSDPGSVERWLDVIDSRARAAAAETDAHDEPRSQFLEEFYSMSIAKIATSNADPDTVRAWLDDIDTRATRTAGDPDAHDSPPHQFLANVYSMVIAKLADRDSDPGRFEQWVDAIEGHADTAATDGDAHDVSPGRFLMNVYGMTLSNLVANSSDPTTASEWVDAIEARMRNVAANPDLHDEPPGEFLTNVYGMGLASLAEDTPDPGVVEQSIDAIEARAKGMATDSSAHGVPPGEFLSNLYPMVISNLTGRYSDPGTAAQWVDAIERRAKRTAVDTDIHRVPPGQFLTNVYGMAVSSLADTNPTPSVVEEWIDDIEARATETAVAGDAHRLPAGQFLANTYSMVVSKLAETHPEPGDVEEWVDAVERRATATATDADVTDQSPAAFLENVYSMSLSHLSETHPDPDFEWLQAWLDALAGRLPGIAAGAGVSSRGEFIGAVTALMAIRIDTNEAIDSPWDWHRAILTATLTAVETPDLWAFIDGMHTRYLEVAAQAKVPMDGLVMLTAVLLDRCADDQDPLLDSPGDRVDLLGRTVADLAFERWVYGDAELDGRVAGGILSVVGQSVADDVELLVGTVATADRRLAALDVSDWLRSVERGDDQGSVRTLRDRLVAGIYSAAVESVAGEEGDSVTLHDIAEAVRFESDLDGTTRLYRAGLQAVTDGATARARATLRLAWVRGRTEDPGTEAHARAVAAGVGWAASLDLQESPTVDPAAVLERIEPHSESLSPAADALRSVVAGDGPAIDPGRFTDGIDPESDPHDLDDLGAVAYATLLRSSTTTASDHYVAGIRAIARQDTADAVRSLRVAWRERADTDPEADPQAYTDALAAGVMLVAYADLGVDPDALGLAGAASDVLTAVDSKRDRLAEPVAALLDTVHGESPTIPPSALREDAAQAASDREELERLVCASLIETIRDENEGSDEAPSESTGTDDETPPNDHEPAETEGTPPADLRKRYRSGLEHIIAGDRTAAVGPLMDAWDFHDRVTDERARRLALGAGVALAAQIRNDPALSGVCDEAVETVTGNEAVLPDPVRAVLGAITDEGRGVAAEELPAEGGGDSEECSLAAVEERAFRTLLESIEE